MVSSNIVLIETIDCVGTGFLYPCKVKGDYNLQYFIVFTNAHVLQNIGTSKSETADACKGQIFLTFYDSLGHKVQHDDIKKIRIYNSGNFMNSEEDIAAILIAIEKAVPMAVEARVCSRQPENRETLYLEGYPGVLLEDEVCSRIQLEGMAKKIFPENKKLGIYQITDDYHWYNDYKDRRLLEGLSGSLVYLEENGRTELLGMAQSVSDIQRGENPFKLMYYIKFTQILKHLREANCIIFSRDQENRYQIQWIYEMPGESGKNVTLLLLGSSGAGKSSFAKDFAYHGKQIYSTSDGQTTRTKVFYNYRLENKCSSNKVDVQLLTKEDFADRMIEKMGQRPALLKARCLFGLQEASIKNPAAFLEKCRRLMELLKEKAGEEPSSFGEILDDISASIHYAIPNRDIIKCYDKIMGAFCKYFPPNFIKYILDEHCIEGFREKYQQKKLEKEVFDYRIDPEFQPCAAAFDFIEPYLAASADSKDAKFKKFQEAAVSRLLDKNPGNYEAPEAAFSEEFRGEYINSLLSIEGYFALEEFQNLSSEGFQEELIEDLKKEIGGKEKRNETRFAFNTEAEITEIYGKLHSEIKKLLIEKYAKYGIAENSMSLGFDLCKMNGETRKLLQMCLQITPQGSLTGLVNYVTINDMVSDEYAAILKDLQIDQLQLVDTCGLDHVELASKQELLDLLYQTRYFSNSKGCIELENINVLYIKKLDSGKPDELRQVLPCVREVFPAAPVYCVLTGIDIFYRTAEEIASIDWSCPRERQPKVVNYLLSSRGKLFIEGAKEDEQASRENHMYLVMRNNLIPYCGKKNLIRDNYFYYKNNVSYIWKLLSSIAMKEYSSLEIIDTKLIDMVMETIEGRKGEKTEADARAIEHVLSAAERFIRRFFEEASLKNYRYRYNTKRADIRSFCKQKQLGYYGTYRHRLDQLFHEAYKNAIAKYSKELAGCFAPAQAALLGALKNMELNYLGSGGDLIFFQMDHKNEFRRLLEKMYETGGYEYNPFHEEYEQFMEKAGADPSLRDKIFNEIFNFSKGLENRDILTGFMNEFLRCLKKQIDEDNRQKSENLLKLNPDFLTMLEDLENSYLRKYQTGDGGEQDGDQKEMRKNFQKLMNYYFMSKD